MNTKMMTQEEFDNLNVEQKRVEIAKDVMEILEAERIVPVQGIYLMRYADTDEEKEFWGEEDGPALSAEESLECLNNDKVCYVCAKGAIALGMFRRGIGLEFDPNRGSSDPSRNITGFFDLFPTDYIDDIEREFEGRDTPLETILCHIIKSDGKVSEEGKLPIVGECL